MANSSKNEFMAGAQAFEIQVGDQKLLVEPKKFSTGSVGYFANEDYFVPVLRVKDMARLHRGRKLVRADGVVHNVRLKRSLEDEKKIGAWEWMHNPFTGTREWNGLRVLMAVINNWDLKDINNAIRVTRDNQIYEVSDLGGSFGSAGLERTSVESDGNVRAYRTYLLWPSLLSSVSPTRNFWRRCRACWSAIRNVATFTSTVSRSIKSGLTARIGVSPLIAAPEMRTT